MVELRLENSIVDERYYVEQCLGRGSYAEIFLAFDHQHNELPVIIKALNASLQGTPDVELKRTLIENFQNEAIALDKVRHPHIIRRLGHGSAADLSGTVFHYLVLEYMAGGDLLSTCNKRPFTLSDTLFYFQQVAEALAYAHSQQVIHRDIKPKNLLLSADRRTLKIADFGVAKMTHDANTEITRVGTDIYAPPEHHPDGEDGDSEADDEKLTPSADVYSLAKTIYTAMTGRAPRQFSRKPITSLPPELASQVWGEALLGVLRKATATRVANRYATVQDFWQGFAAVGQLAAAEDEKTLVRSRLKATSDVERPSSQPNFQVVTAAAKLDHNPQKARIIVELPQRTQEAKARIQDSGALEGRAPNAVPNTVQGPTGPLHNGPVAATVSGGSVGPLPPGQPSIIAQQNVVKTHTRAMGSPIAQDVARGDRGVLHGLRRTFKSDWLLRIFIIFLIAALVGVIASTYFHFAGNQNVPAIINWLNDKDGEISATFVNLRTAPNSGSEALRWLPRGTKFRQLEEREGWLRIKILSVPPVDLPPDAPRLNLDASTGWINKNLAQF